MAKKTVKVSFRSADVEPAAGDVNISYKGVRIAGLSESSTAVLETENTIVQDDIEVEYTPPAPEILTIPVYTKIANATPVHVIDFAGYAGGDVNDEVPCPSSAGRYQGLAWDNGEPIFWNGVLYTSATDPFIEVKGYIPGKIPDGATCVHVLFSEH